MEDKYDRDTEVAGFNNLLQISFDIGFPMYIETKPQQRLFEITCYPPGKRYDFPVSHKAAASVTIEDIKQWTS